MWQQSCKVEYEPEVRGGGLKGRVIMKASREERFVAFTQKVGSECVQFRFMRNLVISK